jgi:hypothetical protein
LLAGEKDLLEMIATGETLPVILDALCRLAEKLLVGSLGAVLLMDLDGKRLRHGAAPSLPVEYTNTVDGALISPAAGSCGTAAYHGKKRQCVRHFERSPVVGLPSHRAGSRSSRLLFDAILSSGGKVLGTFRPLLARTSTVYESRAGALRSNSRISPASSSNGSERMTR